MSEYFPKPLRSYRENINVRVDLSNYATKVDIKNITYVDTSGFALKIFLANLNTEVDKLKPVPTDLSKLSNVVKNEVVRKNTYDKLVAKVNNIDTSGFLLKTKYDSDKLELENKIPDTSDLVKKTNYNTKVTELENKIPDISNLATTIATTTALTIVENKIRNISNLATKAELTTVENKIPDISNLATKTLVNRVENKVPDTNNLAKKTTLTSIENKIPDASNLATKAALTTVENKITDIRGLVKKSDYNTKITEVENNIKKLGAYNSSYYSGKKYFDEEDGKQNYLVFLPKRKYFKLNSVAFIIDCVLSWQSKGLSNESIKPPATSNNSLNPKLNYYSTKTRVQFIGSCLKHSSPIFTHKKVVNIYVVYELAASSSHINDSTIKNCLFGAVTLTKHAHIEKYKYSG